MSATVKTLAEITIEAEKALYDRLGVVNAVRYLNQFRTGSGDYTKERDATLGGKSVDEIINLIREKEAENLY